MDVERRFRDHPQMARHSRGSSLDRARPLVAFLLRSSMGHQRRDFLCAVVYDEPVAEVGADYLGDFPNALSETLQYLSLQFPVDHSWTITTACNNSSTSSRCS